MTRAKVWAMRLFAYLLIGSSVMMITPRAFGADLWPIEASAQCLSISATSTASAAAALPTSSANQIRFVNDSASTGTAFLAIGGSGVTATVTSGTANATSNPVLVGEDSVFTRDPNGQTFVSAITNATKTATVYVCVGNGM